MTRFQRRAAVLLLVCVVMSLSTALVRAQDTAPRIAGSGLAAPVVQTIADDAGLPVTITVNGSSAGLADFCVGALEIALSARPITAAEEAACTISGVNFHELLLGHNILSVVANTADNLPQCLTPFELNAIFAPSAAAIDWTGIASDVIPALPLTIALPSEGSVAYTLLDNLVEGVGLRTAGVTPAADNAAVLAAVTGTPGAIGVITTGTTLPDGLRAFEIDSGISGCAAPTVANTERRIYPAADRLFAYVNAAQVETARPLLDALFAESALTAAAPADFTPPSEAALTQNRAVLSDGTTGRQFSREVTAFTIPENLVGEITIAGSLEAQAYLQSVISAFNGGAPGVTVQYQPLGVIDGIERFCNGELDMVTAFAALTDEQLAACAQNEVTPETFSLGAFAPVVVVGNGTEFVDCLTTAETALIFGATGDTVVENWTGVRAGFADQALTLFTPSGTTLLGDLLVRATPGAAPRADGEVNADPAYRAAAVANVVGGVTFMSYPEFLGLPAIEAERVRAVPIDGGAGCVSPDNATLTDGTYALSRPVLLLVRRSSIARQDVQSFLWTLNSDASFGLIGTAGLAGIAFDDLAVRRDAIEALFPVVMQEVADAMIAPEATAEAAPPIDSTPEVGPEPTAEATPAVESTPESSGG